MVASLGFVDEDDKENNSASAWTAEQLWYSQTGSWNPEIRNNILKFHFFKYKDYF